MDGWMRRFGFGSALLVGMYLQVRTPAAPAHAPAEVRKQSTESGAATPPVGPGPWIASCNYWSAAKTAGLSSPENSPVAVRAESGKSEAGKPLNNANCGADRWGIDSADEGGTGAPVITAIVATVPDPIHSHLALDFDRAIDAILLAAADNHYVSSNYWIPWRSQISTAATGESTAGASRPTPEDYARERQPGLIVLRYNPDAKEASSSGFEFNNYHRVIYLFLVAETPSLGVNGHQLQNAFAYERFLKKNYAACLSIRAWSPFPAPAEAAKSSSVSLGPIRCPDSNDVLSVIGPSYSGSASSLHAGIASALSAMGDSSRASIAGTTGTEVAANELAPKDKRDKYAYRSFGEDVGFEEENFLDFVKQGYNLTRVAVLSEAGTVFGGYSGQEHAAGDKDKADDKDKEQGEGPVLNISFPRELSLLRNAEPNQSAAPEGSTAPTPYLNLSLKDNSADDTVPRFSTNQSPLSIESQLIAIAHQLQRARSQFIIISASNVLDDIFLAQFLHRACPDARLVILSGGDLLFERDADNASYIGSISITPYLLSSLDFGSRRQWLHAGFRSEEVYNAASYTFWNSDSPEPPLLAGYRNYPVADSSDREEAAHDFMPVQFQQIPLWATVIGADGYYPLAILNWCSSRQPEILPTFFMHNGEVPTAAGCKEEETSSVGGNPPKLQNVWKYVPEAISQNSGISPTLLWTIFATFILIACVLHCAALLIADLWSPFTRDLAIDHNDLPHRRAVYLNIGTTVLVAMAFVTTYPLLVVAHFYSVGRAIHFFAYAVIVIACITTALTFAKTIRYSFSRMSGKLNFFNILALGALIGITCSWIYICDSGNSAALVKPTYVGLFFCYRCLRPLSGVCPLIPILLLLGAWYLWAIYQTARLRFSEIHRPRLPRLLKKGAADPGVLSAPYQADQSPYPLFIPDEALEGCGRITESCLYDNIMTLLITGQILDRFGAKLEDDRRRFISRAGGAARRYLDTFLLCVYLLLFTLCVLGIRIHSVERFLFASILWKFFPTSKLFPTPYEFLIMALFFPLIMVALSGWLRVIMIWGSLSRGLLEPLERLPLRFAFSRFKGGSWMSMLRQKGLHIRWRDMARSTESIRQLVHHPKLDDDQELHVQLLEVYESINARIHILMESIRKTGKTETIARSESESVEAAIQRSDDYGRPWPSDLWDLPEDAADLSSIYHVEQGYAEFCRVLIDGLLEHEWDTARIGHVEESSLSKKEDKEKEPTAEDPTFVQLAEELLVVRYVALIRAVLINIRYLMLIVSTAFVLALIAWNSYPFQPHAFIDWCFTILLAILTLGFVWVFAQMHRNAILSRITDTTANELGWEFYLRIISFGAVPILTWLAYQFPAIGGSIYRIVQPGLEVVK